MFNPAACVYAARMLGCEGDGNAGVGSGRGLVALREYMGGTLSHEQIGFVYFFKVGLVEGQ